MFWFHFTLTALKTPLAATPQEGRPVSGLGQISGRIDALASESGGLLVRRFGLLLLAWFATLVPLAIVTAACLAVAYADIRFAHGAAFVWLMAVFGLPVVAAVRALFAAQNPPDGEPIDLTTVPQLDALLRDTAAACDAPKIEKVLITRDFNCGVVQRARFGVLFSHENYLTLGLPLMLSLTPAQFRAILAHEFGHISRGHGRLGATVYAIRASWFAMHDQIARRSSFIVRAMLPFYRWFVPMFDRASASVTRDLERESDQIAQRVAGSEACAEALVTSAVRNLHIVKRFWQPLESELAASSEPPVEVFVRLSSVANSEVPDAAELLAQYRSAPPTPHDTHPTLDARLSALNVQGDMVLERIAQPVSESAFSALFASTAGPLLIRESQQWVNDIRPIWRQAHSSQMARQERLRQLDERASQATLEPQEARQRALLAHSERRADALALLESTHDDSPEDPQVGVALGEALLPGRESEGIALLEEIARARMEFAIPCYQMLVSNAIRKGQSAEAARFRSVMNGVQAQVIEAQRERANFSAHERLDPHHLSDDEVAQVESSIKGATGVESAYLVRRTHSSFPRTPSYYCAILREPNLNGIGDVAFARHVQRSGPYPAGILFQVIRPEKDAALLEVLRSVPGAHIYQAHSSESAIASSPR